MQKDMDGRKTTLGELKYRRRNLRIVNAGMRLLQILVTGVCVYYVVMNYIYASPDHMPVRIGGYTFVFNGAYLSSLCLVFSIILAFWPQNRRAKVNLIDLAIKAVKSGGDSEWEDNAVNDAKVLITDVDRAHQKKKENRENEIVPHEKRMVMRRYLKIWGIPGFTLLFILQLFFHWNFPQILAVDLFIGYLMVMSDHLYYQWVLRKDKIAVMTEEHRKIITGDLNRAQHYKLMQKILYMEADRYANYGQFLSVTSSVLNVFAILLTLLDKSSNEVLIRFFSVRSDHVNAEVSVVFMVISVLFLLLDMYFQSYIGMKTAELKSQEKMRYCEGSEKAPSNYNFMVNLTKSNQEGKNTFLHTKLDEPLADLLLKPFRPLNSIFSRNAMDVSRGRYDYNNDALVAVKYRNSGDRIPAECMSTVEDSFPGRVPRFKFSAGVVWGALFCFLIWGGMPGRVSDGYFQPVNLLFVITIFTLILYDSILFFFGALTWNKSQNWLLFEKEMEKYTANRLSREVRWDFISYFTGHSILMNLLACGYAWWNERHIPAGFLSGMIIFTVLAGIIGYRLAKVKRSIAVSQSCYDFAPVIVLASGALYCFSAGEYDLFQILVLWIIVPAFLFLLARYLKRVKERFAGVTVKIPLCAAFLLMQWLTVIVLLCFSGKLSGGLWRAGLIWLYAAAVIISSVGMVWEIKNYWEGRQG